MTSTSRARAQRRRQWFRRIPALLTIVGLLAVATIAFMHRGVTTTRIDVNDGGIWVTNPSKQLVGHLNPQTRTLDGAFRTETARFDIHQFENSATFNDTNAHAVAPIDVAGVRLGAATSMPSKSQVVQGGHKLGILDPAKGNLWVADAASPSSLPMSEATAVVTDMEGGVVTAAADGTVMAVGVDAKRFVIVGPQADGKDQTSISLPDMQTTADLTMTAVGNRPVALDSRNNTLFLPSGRSLNLTSLGVEAGVLQIPGPAADDVVLATGRGVARIGLDSGQVSQVEATTAGTPGKAAAPARVAGCIYGAWSISGAFLRLCDGLPEHRQKVDSLVGAGDISFRVNRKIIVLNDIGSGTVWLPDNNMVMAANWDEIDNDLKQDKDTETSPQNSKEIADPERKEKNTPPVASDDDFGVRPGRTTTLDVLGNDSDPDGDVLTARALTTSTLGPLSPTRGGRALQIGVDAKATGSTSFTYEASDGRAVATAKVRVNVRPWNVNAGPQQLRNPVVVLGGRAEVQHNVLPQWRDPDGDPIFLESVSAPDGLQVRFQEEGTVTIRDLGRKPGRTSVSVTLSDGKESTKGTILVDVAPTGNRPPIANGDFYVAQVNEETLIQPLANDSDPNGDTLHLAGLSAAPAGTTVRQDPHLGSLTFTAKAKGTYYLSYTVSDGPDIAKGVIRIDVVAANATAVPVAEDDMVLLPKGGVALSAPLNNDSDPAGGVLVLQTIDATAAPQLDVTIVDRHLLRITAPNGLNQPATLGYTVSNGTHTASAKVLVVPTKAQDDTLPPQPQPDRITVRTGDIGTALVLANDRSPAGLSLTVDSVVKHTSGQDLGKAFVTGSAVRLQAADKPGTMVVAYSVRDSAGNSASSSVTFDVVGNDGKNSAPRPKDLTAWSVSGQTARIPVPLTGIDPDGDSVTLAGLEQPPAKGVTKLGTDWLEYTPAENRTGTDTFTYIVEDRQGKQASARVRIGIAPRSTANQRPSAVADTLLVRPNRSLAIDVLANDIDPDGDPLRLDTNGVISQSPLVKFKVDDKLLQVNSPAIAGSYVLRYRVLDGRGGSADGTVTLNVSDNAPLLAPIARDDVLAMNDVPIDGRPATVDVLANDEDPDGHARDLTVSSTDKNVLVVDNKLLITPDEQRRTVVYTVTDKDKLTSSAVVSLPGTLRERPVLGDKQLTLRAGQKVAIDIQDYVKTRKGRTPRIIDKETVRASVGSEGPPVLLNDHVIEFTAAKDFAGESALSFRVVDGTLDDRSALSASLTLPIKITSTVNHPPHVAPTGVMVAAGEPPVRVDLPPMVTDPDKQDPNTFTYKLLKSPQGASVRQEGNSLLIGAALDTRKQQLGSAQISVDDGSGPVTADIPISVGSSTRPKIIASDALVPAANAGEPVKVDLNQYIINPFPDQPVKVLSTQLESGQGKVDPQGTTLTITPAAVGAMAVRYRMADATGDQDRYVEGRVKLVVRDKPAPPVNVAVIPSGAGKARVTFEPGAANGAPITSYELTDVTSRQKFTCEMTDCPVSGLENGVEHAFVVVAKNEVGPSKESMRSPAVLIDMRPETPSAPLAEPKDRSVLLTWTPPRNEGSAIKSYTIFVPADGRKISVPGNVTSYTVTGLTNGSSYTFAIQAQNSAKEPSGVSEASSPVIPFGKPGAPSNVTGKSVSGTGTTARVLISWELGDLNGGVLSHCTVNVNGQQTTVNAPATSASLDVEVGSVNASVTMTTQGGTSSSASTRFTAFTVPVKIDQPTLTANGENGQLVLSGVRKKSGNGFESYDLTLRHRVNGGPDTFLSGNQTLTGLTNGEKVVVEIWQRGEVRGERSVDGEPIRLEATPYGPPLKPELSATAGPEGVTFSWSIASLTNGGPPATLELVSPGNNRKLSGTSGTVLLKGAPGERMTATVKACEGSRCTSSDSASAYMFGQITSVKTAACTGNEKPAGPKDTCHTFTVETANWRSPVSCTFVSDIDGETRRFDVLRDGSMRSNMRTNVVDNAVLQKWIGDRLKCSPN